LDLRGNDCLAQTMVVEAEILPPPAVSMEGAGPRRRLTSGNLGLRLLSPATLELSRRQVLGGAVQPALVHQSTHSAVASSTCSSVRQGPRRRMSSVL
jgi:hypothetical protein